MVARAHSRCYRRVVRMVAALVWLAAAQAALASWDTARRTVVDPLNSALHRHLPQYLQKRDLDGVLGLYATETGEGLGWDGSRRIHAAPRRRPRAGTVRRARSRCASATSACSRSSPPSRRRSCASTASPGATAAQRASRATARLLVRGTRADGARAQLEQHMRWVVTARDGHWQITREEVTARTLVARQAPRFTSVTESAGLTSVHDNAGSPAFRLFGGGPDNPVRASAGSAVADVDGDGCEDVFLAGSPEASLYRNRCDGTFVDVTATAGLPRPWPAAATGVALLRLRQRRPPGPVRRRRQGRRPPVPQHGERALRRRERDGRHPAPGAWGSMAIAADYDRDGFLDLYVVRMGDHAAACRARTSTRANGVANTLLPQPRRRHVRRRHRPRRRRPHAAGTSPARGPTTTAMAGPTSTSPTSSATTRCTGTRATAPSATGPRRPASPTAAPAWASHGATTTATATSTCSSPTCTRTPPGRFSTRTSRRRSPGATACSASSCRSGSAATVPSTSTV